MQDIKTLSFKEMCARFDVTPRTLRYYEYIELLSPRREGRSRLYGPREVARMTLILRGRRFGFSLEDIRQWLQLYEERGSREQYQVFLDMADRQLAAMDAQIAEQQTIRDELRSLRDDTDRLLADVKAARA